MPTQREIQALGDALTTADDERFLAIVRAASYRLKASEQSVRIPGRQGEFVFNKPLTVDEYLRITGLTVPAIRSRVIADICDNAWSQPDQFYAVLRAANVPADADSTVQAVASIRDRAGDIAGSSERAAASLGKRWYRDAKWLVGIAVAVVALAAGIWRLVLAMAK